jgi:tetratricopeptide (TPR) repeat protein
MTHALLPSVLLLFAAASGAEDLFHAGLVALDHGDLTAAQTNLEAARTLAPRDGRVWVALSQTYWRQHRNSEAEDAAAKAAAFAPEDPVVLQALTIYYAETDQTLKAARTAAKYAAPRAAELYFDAAKPLLDRQKFADAAVILQESVERVPKNAQLELALGVACYGLRRFDDAAEAFLRTIDIAPETEQPYTFLGKILDQIPNQLPRVTERFAAYEAAHPASATAYLLHAKALDAQSIAPETARRLLEKSIALDGAEASAHFEMGTVLDRLERFSDAAAAFERAAQIAPADAAAHYRLARDYDRIGKHDAAQAEREKHAQLVRAQEPIR